MTRRRGVCAVVAMLVAAAWLLGAPGAALAVKERQPLTGPPCGSGPTVGKVVIKDLQAGGVKVKVRIKNGTPNGRGFVYWLGVDAPKSCAHSDNGLVLGEMTTDGLGKGRFVIVLPGGNPLPGKFVRIETDAGGDFFALFDNIFQ